MKVPKSWAFIGCGTLVDDNMNEIDLSKIDQHSEIGQLIQAAPEILKALKEIHAVLVRGLSFADATSPEWSMELIKFSLAVARVQRAISATDRIQDERLS